MFVKFITSKLLRVIVCAAAGLYGLYNAISCFVTLYKAGHQPYLMAGTVRFDFQGYYMMAAMHVGICLLLGVQTKPRIFRAASSPTTAFHRWIDQ